MYHKTHNPLVRMVTTRIMVIQVEDRPEETAMIRLDRPESMNAMSTNMVEEVKAALRELPKENKRAIIIAGVDGMFSAGADVNEFMERLGTPDEQFEYFEIFEGLYHRVEDCPVPVIAEVNGPAHGAAAELVTACDMRVASTKASIKLSEIDVALIPPFKRLRRHLSRGLVNELCYTGRELHAEEAEGTLFNHVIEPEALESRTNEVARAISSKSDHAIRQTKEALRESDQLLPIVRNYKCMRHDHFTESVRAFAENREPDYSL